MSAESKIVSREHLICLRQDWRRWLLELLCSLFFEYLDLQPIVATLTKDLRMQNGFARTATMS